MRKWIALLVVVGLLLGTGMAIAAYKKEFNLSVVVGPKGPSGESAAMFAKSVKEINEW